MKTHINRRNFLLGTLSTAATTTFPFTVKASTGVEQRKKNYLDCGKINSTDLRRFYYAGTNTTNDQAIT